ncbi:MAG: SGNH/GDSL hydrolase family protein [Actinobacteria bacterium]|nr:SGNH/GDSL hydrolase family protein [Actinomycetota bacterium]
MFRAKNRKSIIGKLLFVSLAFAISVSAGSSTPFTPNTGPSLLILGDSITWGTDYFAKAQKLVAGDGQWVNVVVDGQYSRRVAFPTPNTSIRMSGVKSYLKLKAEGLNPDAVIVALGSNDVALETKPEIYEKIIRDLMNTIGNVPVTWLTVNRRDTKTIFARSVVFNTVLVKLTSEYPNLVLSDWSAIINDNPKLMSWDKVHLTPTGYVIRAKSYQSLARDIYERYWIATAPTTTTTLPAETTTTTTIVTTTATTLPAVTTTIIAATTTVLPTTTVPASSP